MNRGKCGAARFIAETRVGGTRAPNLRESSPTRMSSQRQPDSRSFRHILRKVLAMRYPLISTMLGLFFIAFILLHNSIPIGANIHHGDDTVSSQSSKMITPKNPGNGISTVSPKRDHSPTSHPDMVTEPTPSNLTRKPENVQYYQFVHGNPLPRLFVNPLSFCDMRKRSSILVDKSLFIKELVDTSRNLFLITRPQFFGKTLNLQMLKRFIQIEVDKRGIPLPENEKNSNYFLGGEVTLDCGDTKLLHKLKIAEHHDIIHKYLGKFPVIHMSLEGLSHRSLEATLEVEISHMYQEHIYLSQYYLPNATYLNYTQKELLRLYMWRVPTNRTMETYELEDSIRFLSELLYHHYKRKVYVLIDEYPLPLNYAYQEYNDDSEAFFNVTAIMRNLFGRAFVRNPYFARAIITGTIRIANVSLLNEEVLEQGTLLDKEYSKHYGFTQPELDKLLKQVPTKFHPTAIKTRHNCYNYADQIIYSPRAISDSSPLHRKDSTGMEYLITSVLAQDRMQETLHLLLQQRPLRTKLQKQIFLSQIDKCNETLLSAMVMEGYLNPVPFTGDGDSHMYHLVIPNREVGEWFAAIAERWIRRKMSTPYFSDTVALLASGHASQFVEDFQDRLQTAWLLVEEVDYYHILRGLVSLLAWRHRYTVWPNLDSQEDPCNYVVIPEPNSGSVNVYVIQCKVEWMKFTLNDTAADGMKKIAGQQFDSENVAIYDRPRSITRNQPERPKRPVIEMGENRFEHFLKASDIFVDKSLLIKEILECNKTIVVTSRPEHWGKSLNLDMLHKFLELEVDEQGTPLLEENRINHKLFIGGEIEYGYDEWKPLRKLRIAEHPNLIRKFQGQSPVIHLDMSELPAHDYVEMVDKLKDQIFDTYWEYLCGTLNQTGSLDNLGRERLKFYCRQKALRELGMEHCLKRLIETLFNHYKRKVYVLIDNYSDPIYEAREGYADAPECYHEISRLFADIYANAFLDNPCLEKAILTGVGRTIDLDLFPATITQHVQYDTLFEQKFSQYYGFTQEEVDELLKKVPTQRNPNHMKTRYLGYNYRERILYNPQSVANYIAYDQIPHYHVENSHVFEQVEKILISGNTQISLHSLLRGKSVIIRDSTLLSGGSLDQRNVYQFLANSGFLNPIPTAAVPGSIPLYHLTIPNREKGQLYVVCVSTWIRDTFSKRSLFEYYDIIHILVKGEVYRFKRRFLEYLSNSPLNSTTKRDCCNLIGGTVSLLAWGYWYWKYGYTVWSDVDSFFKGCSYMLIPNTETVHVAFVIGCKVLETEHVVASVAKAGLRRIGGSFVKEKLTVYRHVRKLIKLYVVFCKSTAAVEHEIITVC